MKSLGRRDVLGDEKLRYLLHLHALTRAEQDPARLAKVVSLLCIISCRTFLLFRRQILTWIHRGARARGERCGVNFLLNRWILLDKLFGAALVSHYLPLYLLKLPVV